MVFLYALAGFASAYLIRKLLGLIVIICKKKAWDFKAFFLSSLIDEGITLGFSLLIALFVFLFFKGVYPLNVSLMFFCFSLLLLLIAPYSSIKNAIKNHSFKSRRFICGGISLLLMLSEVFLANHNGLNQKGETIDCSFSSSLVTTKYRMKEEENGYSFSSDSYFIVKGLDEQAGNVFQLCFDEAPSSVVTVAFYSSGTSSTKWNYQASYDINPAYPESCQMRLPDNLTSSTKITLSIDQGRSVNPTSLVSTGFKLNAPILFLFSPLRFIGVVALVYFFAYIREIFAPAKEEDIIRREKQKFSFSKKLVSASLLLGACALVVFGVIAYLNQDFFFYTKEYVSKNVQSTSLVDIYADYFLALSNGSYKLNILPSSSLLEAEKAGLNIYDRELRSELWINAAWDHAYYQGSYYCYYSILPVLLVYFPVYWLSGGSLIAKPIFAQLLGQMILVPVFFLLLYELAKLAGKKPTLKQLLFVFVVTFITSMMIPLVTYKDATFHEGIYHLPIVYALLNLDLFFLFALKAYSKPKGRSFNLALSGLFYVFMVCCRPNLVFTLIILLPLFLKLLIVGDEGFGKRLLSFIPMLMILLAGAGAMCYFNYLRFGSILEFGQSYQINNDQTHMTYSLDKLFPSLIHWLFQGPVFYDQFPYLSCSVMNLSFDNIVYNQGYYGVLLVPLFWLSFANVFLYKKDNWVRAMLGLLPIFILIEGFTTYSKAGICARYLLETYHIASLGVAFSIFMILEHYEKKEKPNVNAPLLISLASLISVFICFNLSFDSFDGQNISDLGGIYLKIKEAFLTFNY